VSFEVTFEGAMSSDGETLIAVGIMVPDLWSSCVNSKTF